MTTGATQMSAPSQLARIRTRLLAWYAVEQRDFPWRRTKDPWAVLVSEVMLQQTQASRVAERFPPFLRRFPTASAMAASSDADVLAAWTGLGYNRRALALRRAALAVSTQGWPREVAGLELLPGVGHYTARAVAALAFGRPVGAVDTNVRRWLVRRFRLPVTAPATQLQDLADGLASAGRAISADQAAAWMHASMEFGAKICLARAPVCSACPVARGCPSRAEPFAVPVKRQAAFAGSDRAGRGSILRALVRADGHRLTLTAATALVGGAGAHRLLTGLERDGLVHRSGGWLRLGGLAEGGPPTTIEP